MLTTPTEMLLPPTESKITLSCFHEVSVADSTKRMKVFILIVSELLAIHKLSIIFRILIICDLLLLQYLILYMKIIYTNVDSMFVTPCLKMYINAVLQCI